MPSDYERGTAPKPKVPRAIDMIAGERQRQISKEGWTPEHDDMHIDCSMSLAAACYAVEGTGAEVVHPDDKEEPEEEGRRGWPWDAAWDKRGKHSRLRRLVIAGALIAAEIDREIREALAKESVGVVEKMMKG